jgi:hypothetical protein
MRMGDWFNYEATLKILVFSVVAGAALPGLFAFGLRMQAVGSGAIDTDGAAPHRNPVLVGIAWAIYALVLAVIIFGILYIARDFIANHTGYPFLGAQLK